MGAVGNRASAQPLNLSQIAAAADLQYERLDGANSGPLAGHRNRLINGNFAVMQRGYASPVGPATSGTYMHDRWKAGAGGCTYTYVAGKPDTTITITAGSIMQVVEDVNVEGGAYILTWTGTAQGRVGINGAAPGGAYAASPVVVTGSTAGQQVTVEFNAGTLGKVQLEPAVAVNGAFVASPFERRLYGTELLLCQRYCEAGSLNFIGNAYAATLFIGNWIQFHVAKRASPTITTGTPSQNTNLNTLQVEGAPDGMRCYANSLAAGGAYYSNSFLATAEL